MINLTVIYVMWLRDMKRFVRSPSRLIGNLIIPFLLLISLGTGFGKMAIPGISGNIGYFGFLVPGMAAMTILFTGMFSGLSVLWDRQYGFLKEDHGGAGFQGLNRSRPHRQRSHNRGRPVISSDIHLALHRVQTAFTHVASLCLCFYGADRFYIHQHRTYFRVEDER